jgi:hypothetical protein
MIAQRERKRPIAIAYGSRTSPGGYSHHKSVVALFISVWTQSMTSGLHLLEIGIAIAVFGGLLYWAFTAWSRSHERHQEELRSRQLKIQARDPHSRNR